MQAGGVSPGNKPSKSATSNLLDRTWKQLQQGMRANSDDFSQLLAQIFLLLEQQAREKNDEISVRSLEIINAGLMDLARMIDQRKTAKQPAPTFTPAAYNIFSRLSESYNNPALLRQAGVHYLSEWSLPQSALAYFERALELGGQEHSLQSLIEVASLSAQRKAAPRRPSTVESGITEPPASTLKVSQAIHQTSKQLLTRTQRPTPRTPLVLKRSPKTKTAVAAPLPDASRDTLKEAARELEAGNLPRARELLLKVSRQPVRKDVLCGLWSNLGRAWYQAGNPAGMEEAYSEAYALDPKRSETYFNLALAKSLAGKIDEAETLYQFAAKLDPSNAKIWCNLGVLYFQHDRFKDAEDAFRSAILYQPDYARAWDNLGSALSAQERADEAIEACKQAIHFRPGFPEAYFKLAGIYVGKGDDASLTEAASALSHILHHPPLAASAHAMLSMIHSRFDEVDLAKASLQRAVEIDPKCSLLQTAWTELEEAIRAVSDTPPAG